jgi:SAM-dependent methyltransferase
MTLWRVARGGACRLRELSRTLRGLPPVGREESYWDAYVRRLRSSGRLAAQPYVGSDWRNEAGFLAVLRQYARPEQRALEIGCGGGRITATAAALFAHVHAADVSEEMLGECRAATTARNVSFHKLDGFTLKEFGDQSLDHVFAHDVFVQLSSVEVYPYLAEMVRVLRPGGLGVVSFYDFVTRFEMFRQCSLRCWTSRASAKKRRLHFVTEEMIRLMLTDVGAEMVDVQKGVFLVVVFRKVRS